MVFNEDVAVETIVELDLTSAQILALNTTPIQLLPAPNAGCMWVLGKLIMSYTYSTAAYSGSADIYYGTTSAGQATSSGLGTLIANTSSHVTVASYAPAVAATAVLNQPLYVASGSNPSAGSGTVKIYVTAYQIVL